MKPDHAYDPICPCNFCSVTAYHLSGAVLKPKAADAPKHLAVVPKPPGEVIFVDFKARKRL